MDKLEPDTTKPATTSTPPSARSALIVRPPVGRGSVNPQAIVSAWLEWMAESRGASTITVANYRGGMRSYLRECVGDRPLGSVSTDDIEAWLLRVRSNGRVGSPATRARDVAMLKAFHRWAFSRGLVGSDLGVLLVTPTVHNRQPKPLPDDVFASAWAQVDSPELGLMVALGYWVGLRRAEIVSLRGADVDVAHRQLLVVRKGGDQGVMPYGELVDLWREFVPHLWDDRWVGWLHERAATAPQEPLCGVLRPNGLNDAIRAWQARTGQSRGASWTPHALRHSFVTNLLRIGMGIDMVADLAGHSSVAVTQKYAALGGGRVAEWHQAERARRVRHPMGTEHR